MKRILLATLLALAAGTSAVAADVGVSISIAQPGAYGRIDIGNFPQPQLLYQQPIVIAPQPVAVVQPPLYLYVPVAHSRNWGRYCARYGACGQPVYFVQGAWYNNVYLPAYRNHRHDDDDDQGDGHGERGGERHGHGRRGGD